jgi:uncharacterized OsmC-like protein
MSAIQVTHPANSRYGVELGQHCLVIDQPEAAGGDNLGPTPVQLFAASIVACAAHYAGSYLARHGLSTEGLTLDGDYVMATDSPPRVASISGDHYAAKWPTLSAKRKAGLIAVASRCTLHNTLSTPPAVNFGLTDAAEMLQGENLDVVSEPGTGCCSMIGPEPTSGPQTCSGASGHIPADTRLADHLSQADKRRHQANCPQNHTDADR